MNEKKKSHTKNPSSARQIDHANTNVVAAPAQQRLVGQRRCYALPAQRSAAPLPRPMAMSSGSGSSCGVAMLAMVVVATLAANAVRAIVAGNNRAPRFDVRYNLLRGHDIPQPVRCHHQELGSQAAGDAAYIAAAAVAGIASDAFSASNAFFAAFGAKVFATVAATEAVDGRVGLGGGKGLEGPVAEGARDHEPPTDAVLPPRDHHRAPEGSDARCLRAVRRHMVPEPHIQNVQCVSANLVKRHKQQCTPLPTRDAK